MPSRAEVSVLRSVNAAVERLAIDALRDFWSTLNLARPEAARDQMLAFFPVLVEQFGEAAAAAAADWYDEARAMAGAAGRFYVTPAPSVAEVAAVKQVRYGARHLFTDSPDGLLTFLEGVASKYVLQPGRETIVNASLEDPAASGWHRETRASESYGSGCRFCRLLASRGAVYRKTTAHFAAHGHCHCVAVPSWDADAPEVSASVYRASARLDEVRRRAENGSASAQATLDRQRAAVREYTSRMDD